MITVGNLVLVVVGNSVVSVIAWFVIWFMASLMEGDKITTGEKNSIFKHATYFRIWFVLFHLWLACAWWFPETAWGLVN
ncbi:MAG: hypothetical protein KBD16_00400 [Candidatus Pacebacteria bacterium]|nr:hypothetical protein [Candidatus Paceibacterota bacterium]